MMFVEGATSSADDPPKPVWRRLVMMTLPRVITGSAILVALAASLSGCVSPGAPLQLASHVDPDRYAGRWYVAANIPYFAERGNVGSFFDISFQPNGGLTDVYTARSKSFDTPTKSYTLSGYIVPDTNNARWRESPVWPVYMSYLILYVDPEYRYALVGYPGRNYGWILTRQPVIDDLTYQSLLNRFKDQGYDTSLFQRVPQQAEQIGKSGFQ
jgi:apolipoprotein D and lipocalin family protein